MKVLVTGGAGYMGSTLVPALLAAGYGVRVLDNLSHGGEALLPVWAHPEFEFAKGDIRDVEMLRAATRGVDAVVHLAAIVGDPACARQPELARAVNLDASRTLIEQSMAAGCRRFVFASTCSNYGRMQEGDQCLNEDAPLRPISLYAETKVAVEQAILDSTLTRDLCATALRFSTLYGVAPRMRFDLTVNEFTAEMLTKGKLVVFGEQFWRPYIHVRDAARAIEAVLGAPEDSVRNEVFNVGATHQNYQKQTIVELIRRIAPEAEVEYVHREEDPRDYRVDFTRIHERLGFRITRTLDDGIEELRQLIQTGIIDDHNAPRYRN